MQRGARPKRAEATAPGPTRQAAAAATPGGRLGPRVAKYVGSTRSSVPPAWSALVAGQPAYRASSAALSLVGAALLLLAPWARARVAAGWPWAAFGAAWVVQGALSWLADVRNLGRTSVWHAVDAQAALLLGVATVLYVRAFVLGGAFGFAAERTAAQLALRACAVGTVAAALCAKRRSGAASSAGDAGAYFRWHAAWHYAIALGLCCSLADGLLAT